VSLPWGLFPSKSIFVSRCFRGVTTLNAASHRVGVDFGVFQPYS
jgi:hypothetical protein